MSRHIVLSVNNLNKIFYSKKSFWSRTVSEYHAVRNVSFSINSGETLGLLGANGAGKTTIMHMLLGTLTPTSGDVLYKGGISLASHRTRVMRRIAFASTYIRLPAGLSVFESLIFFGQLYGLSRSIARERAAVLLKEFDLWDHKDDDAATLSAGQTTRAIIAKAFLHDPELVMLDEPTASLDPDIALVIRSFIKQHQKQHGTALLVTSHNMDEVAHLCSSVLVLAAGSIIASGSPAELAATIKTAHVQLTIEQNAQEARLYAQQLGIALTYEEKRHEFSLNENQIAEFLEGLSSRAVRYSHISIQQPTLEDYFLAHASAQRKTRVV